MYPAKTIDAKILEIKETGMVNIPRENRLCNLPVIEAIIYETKPHITEEYMTDIMVKAGGSVGY